MNSPTIMIFFSPRTSLPETSVLWGLLLSRSIFLGLNISQCSEWYSLFSPISLVPLQSSRLGSWISSLCLYPSSLKDFIWSHGLNNIQGPITQAAMLPVQTLLQNKTHITNCLFDTLACFLFCFVLFCFFTFFPLLGVLISVSLNMANSEQISPHIHSSTKN